MFNEAGNAPSCNRCVWLLDERRAVLTANATAASGACLHQTNTQLITQAAARLRDAGMGTKEHRFIRGDRGGVPRGGPGAKRAMSHK